ncbi:MAG TPA: peptidylprolyl isomerase [Lacipirellulaceae bacterium]|jgi:cyclophilin family peptidyl-prolyl cis-trans isomerase|nr:peptidylprolyl isomerase [Lacipirellulaceae bacterium]
MVYRFGLLVILVISMAVPAEAQRVVRFETTEGDFDMVLNPTNNSALDDYAQNLLNYVQNNAYLGSWINRAAKNQDGSAFVLQMGGFFSHTKRPPPTVNSIGIVNQTFADVPGQPAQGLGFSNTVGTVSLALPQNSDGSTNQNAGSTSFFINAADNSFLDPDFTVFAAIPDMTTVNKINALQTIDRTQDPTFSAQAGGLGQSEVPIDANGFQVFIKNAFLVTDTLTTAKDIAAVQSAMGLSAAAASNSLSASDASALAAAGASGGTPLGLSSTTVPEPTTIGLMMLGAMGFGCVSRRRG